MSHLHFKLALALLIGLPVCLPAQQLGVDEEGCKDSALMPRIAKCSIMQCATKESDTFALHAGPGSEGVPLTKDLEGPMEVIYYLCPSSVSPSSIAKMTETTLKEKGFKVLFSGTDTEDNQVVSAQNGTQWAQMSTYVYNENVAYIQTTIKSGDPDLESTESWVEEFEKRGRAPVYGISFEPGKATLTAESSKALQELMEFLKKQPSLAVRIEGHMDSSGPKAENMLISQSRAAAVESWLTSHGIPKGRLQAQGFGDSRPITENETDEGKAKNRRIEVAKP